MGDKTRIEWTATEDANGVVMSGATWNPVTGCSKESTGCKHCYAEREWPRLTANPATIYFGRQFTDVGLHPERLDQPLRWTKPRKIFVNSMSDLFHPDVPDSFIDSVFAVMAIARQHTFQILTKRAARMQNYMASLQVRSAEIGQAAMHVLNGRFWPDADGIRDLVTQLINLGPLPNVWLGVSVENQKYADERIPYLLATPAAIRWLSIEPMLGLVRLGGDDGQTYRFGEVRYNWTAGIHWVVVGGESGPRARAMHPEWVTDVRDQCARALVPFFFKQWGEWRPISEGADDWYASLHRSKRIAREGEDQVTLDDVFGRTCTVAQGMLHIDGELLGVADPLAFLAGKRAMQVFRCGKKIAGRTLDGVLHDAFPIVKPESRVDDQNARSDTTAKATAAAT